MKTVSPLALAMFRFCVLLICKHFNISNIQLQLTGTDGLLFGESQYIAGPVHLGDRLGKDIHKR